MKIISWNCQGLGNPLTFQELIALVALERPNLVYLMETKNKATVVEGVKRRLKFQNMFLKNPEGIAGGLAILWSGEVMLKVNASTKEFINLECKDPASGYQMRITFLHAPTNFGERLKL